MALAQEEGGAEMTLALALILTAAYTVAIYLSARHRKES